MFGKAKKQKERIRKVFAKYLAEDKIDDILDGHESLQIPVEKNIGYILISFDEDGNELRNLAESIEFFQRYGAMVESLEAVFLKLCIGLVPSERNSDMADALQVIMKKFRTADIDFHSCLYGSAACKVGTIGTSSRMNYCVMIPQYKEKLAELFGMSKGAMKHYSQVLAK